MRKFQAGWLYFFFLTLGSVFAQTDVEKGNEAFYSNKRKEAKSFYQAAIAKPEQKAEAHLMLSILATMENKENEAFAQFENFFKSAENPYPFLFSLWSTESVSGTSSRKSPERVKFLNQLLLDPKANGTLKAMAYSSLGDHFEGSNQFAKGKEQYAKIGAVDVWSMAGVFENISESGFDKTFDPISKPQDDAVFINKNGAKAKWNVMKGNRNDKWVDFSYHYFSDNSIMFAQTFVNSPTDQETVFRIGTSGSLKAWVNDALVLTESEERNNDMDTYQAKVKLNKGFNRILIQIGESEVDRSNFLLRLTDDNGNGLPGLTYSTKYQAYTKSNAPLPALVPVFAEKFFEDRIKSASPKVIDYLLLANAYLRNDKGYEARKALTAAQKLAPNSGYLKFKLLEAYNRSGNETDAKITLEWLKENDSESLLSLNLFYSEEIDKEDYEKAGKIVEKIETLYGLDEDVFMKKIALAGKNKKQDLQISLIEEGYKKYPENYNYVNLKVIVEKDINKSFSSALSVLKKYLKNHYSYDGQKQLSDLYFDNGMIAQGLEAYKYMEETHPYSPNYKNTLAKYFYTSRDYATAEKYYQACLEICPEVYYLWAGLAQIQSEKNNTAKAIEYYQRALELKPSDFDSREQIRKLQNKKELFSYFPQTDVYTLVKNSPAPSTYPDDNSLILLDEIQKIVYAGGNSEEKRIFVVKIMNAEGINRWKQYYISHYAMQEYNVEKAEVIKANGSKVEGSSDGSEVVFTNLEVGDAIHVTYKLKNYNQGKLAKHFWENFYFTHFLPYLTTRYSLLVEPGVNFEYKFSKEKIEPQVRKEDDLTIYTWEKVNQPSIRFEDKMPELSDVGNILFFSSLPDWTYVSNWYYDLAASKSKVNLEVKEAVAKIFDGKTGLTEMQKAKMIYEYIVTNIKYLSVAFLQSGLIPQKASHTLNTKLGDCKDVSTLYVAMCKEAGLKADLVLIATRNSGKYQMLLPTIDFNHCIARLTSGGKEYFIELTSDKLPFNTFYDNLKNANALNITKEGSGQKVDLVYLNPPTKNPNLVIRKAEISLDASDVKVKKQTIKTGVFASSMRDSYQNLGQQDQFKEMQRAIAGDYNQTTLKTLTFKGLEGISDSVVYNFDFFAPDAVTDLSGLKLLALPWSEKARSGDFTFTEDRKYPMDLWEFETDAEEETIELNIPSKLTVSDAPQNLVITGPIAEYSLTSKTVPGKLILTRKFRFKKDEILTSELKDFEVFYRKIVAADNRQVAFKEAPAGGAPAPAPAAAGPKPAAKGAKK
jgi:cytochrome c-type biogenesis protein CcmH/NrfG